MNTTITTTKETRNELVRLKYQLACKDLNEVISKLLNIIKKMKLAREL